MECWIALGAGTMAGGGERGRGQYVRVYWGCEAIHLAPEESDTDGTIMAQVVLR